MERLLVALVCACLSCTGATGAGLDPSAEPVPEAVKTITAREIGGHLRFLASDLMKGRDTASPEARVAAEYLAAHLFAAGAEPLGDDDGHGRTFFQSFPLEVVTPLEAGTELDLILEFNGSKRVIPCKLGSEFILRPHGIVPGEVEGKRRREPLMSRPLLPRSAWLVPDASDTARGDNVDPTSELGHHGVPPAAARI